MPKRKENPPTEDTKMAAEEEEDEPGRSSSTDAANATTTTRNAPTASSSPARKGRRRKRTDDEEDAEHEEEKEAKRPRRMQEGKEESSNDQVMNRLQSEMTAQQQASSPPPVAAAAAAAATHTKSEKVKGTLPTVANLRVPSQRTPGKPIRETARLPSSRDGGKLPVPSMALILDQEEEDRRQAAVAAQAAAAAAAATRLDSKPVASSAVTTSPTSNGGRQDEASNRSPVVLQPTRTTTTTTATTTTTEVPPEAQAPSSSAEIPPIVKWLHKRLRRTSGWFLLFLVLQVLCTGLVINPLLTVTVGSSKVAVQVYKSLLGEGFFRKTLPPPPPPPEPTPEEIQQEHQATERAHNRAQRLRYVTERLNKAREQLFLDVADMGQEGEVLQKVSARGKPERPERALQQRVDQMEALLLLVKKKNDDDDNNDTNEPVPPENWATFRELLGEEDAHFLLDLPSSITLWEPREDEDDENVCEDVPVEPEGLVEEDDFHRALQVLQSDIEQATTSLKQDSRVGESILAWTRQHLGDLLEPIVVEQEQLPEKKETPPPPRPPRGSSLATIRHMIQVRLQQERADRTGKVDYAALRNGGTVISTGTSPSLVDMLPYLNRLAASLSLRFYGHGPEVALMPTYPADALGQCWAFGPDEDSSMGRYATLSVQLAKRVRVTGVSIEHPPREINDKSKAALRAFRLYGFEGPQATGRRWDLGKFEFRLSGDIIQEFEVLTEDEEEEEEIPALQSITLAVDSNWGLQYTCLYRLRVHGEEDDDDE